MVGFWVVWLLRREGEARPEQEPRKVYYLGAVGRSVVGFLGRVMAVEMGHVEIAFCAPLGAGAVNRVMLYI